MEWYRKQLPIICNWVSIMKTANIIIPKIISIKNTIYLIIK